MVKLRNIGQEAVSLYRPSGTPGAIDVEPGGVVEVPGESIDVDQRSDYLLTKDAGTGEHRAWSRSRWELVVDAPAAPKPPAVDLNVTDTPKNEG